MNGMFSNATSFNQSLSTFDTSSVIFMSTMFGNAIAFNQSLSNFDTSNVIDMRYMFGIATVFNQSLSTFDTSSVTDMSYMFYGADAFDQNIGTWDVGNVTSFFDFMVTKTPATYSATNLDDIYNGWSTSGVQPNNFISFGTAKYTAASAAGRAILTGINNWNITDGGI
jgi:surface protein